MTINSSLQAMAVYDPDAKMLAKESQDHGKLHGIEEAVAQAGLPAWHAREAHQHNASLDSFIEQYREYIASGNHAEFSRWCNSNGYGTPPHPQLFISSEQPEDAVAWTTGDRAKPIIGVNKYFEQRVNEYASNYGLSRKEAIQMVITHELFHIVQNDTVKRHGNAYTEQDCEMNLRDYFLHLMNTAASAGEKQKYWRMAKAANERYHAWKKARQARNAKHWGKARNTDARDSKKRAYHPQQSYHRQQNGQQAMGRRDSGRNYSTDRNYSANSRAYATSRSSNYIASKYTASKSSAASYCSKCRK